jgi:Acetoacetate decarboxylase (ADC)
MKIPGRVERTRGRHALVDGIPFTLPVDSQQTPALMAAFPISATAAAELLPGTEVHPLRVWGDTGLLVITVVDYLVTDIGRYIEFSIALACTHGRNAAPALLPGLLQRPYGTGQFVLDLPVSTEVSVKGGKGIWGMPKHQANLDFEVTQQTVASHYGLDGELVVSIEIDRPRRLGLPVNVSAVNYCQFRGMLVKSYIHFAGRMHLAVGRGARARLYLGDHPRVAQLGLLHVDPDPLFTGYVGDAAGALDDHFESWFLSYPQPPTTQPEGLESVVGLGLSQEWLPPPPRTPAKPLATEKQA